jgi:hypothetical protein
VSPRPKLSTDRWVELAQDGILTLLDREHEAAVVWDEVEAKLADVHWPVLPSYIEPHHLSTARQQLLEDGIIVEEEAATRGGRPIGVFHRTDLRRRTTAIDRTSQRKRLLQARYQRWGFGDKSTAALLGPSGERVARASLAAAADAGLRPIVSDFGQVGKVLGIDVPGKFDNGVYMPSLIDDDTPGPTVTVPIEVKNRRGWVYPNSDQLFQLLSKAAALQEARREAAIVPVLICRRHHITTQWMAKQLGFFVIAAKAQFIDWPDDDERLLEEVRVELGYLDLINTNAANDEIRGYISRGLPKIIATSFQRWQHFGPQLKPYFDALRREVQQPSRTHLMRDFRAAAKALGADGGW